MSIFFVIFVWIKAQNFRITSNSMCTFLYNKEKIQISTIRILKDWSLMFSFTYYFRSFNYGNNINDLLMFNYNFNDYKQSFKCFVKIFQCFDSILLKSFNKLIMNYDFNNYKGFFKWFVKIFQDFWILLNSNKLIMNYDFNDYKQYFKWFVKIFQYFDYM